MCLIGCEEHTKQLGDEQIHCPDTKCAHQQPVQHAVQWTKLELCCCIPLGDYKKPREVAYCPTCKWSAQSPQRWPGAIENAKEPSQGYEKAQPMSVPALRQPQRSATAPTLPSRVPKPTLPTAQRTARW